MNVSLNEIDAMSKRACRGAGLPWGLAEEAGKATRWLVAHEFAGLNMLAEIIDLLDKKTLDDVSPILIAGVWRARTEVLSPFTSGAMLCDRAVEIAEGEELVFGPLCQPMVLAPYVTAAARLSGHIFELRWSDIVMTIAADKASLDQGFPDPGASVAQTTCCRAVDREINNPIRRTTQCGADPKTWARLNDYAHRIYAPATEASRLAGAGAGTTDRD